MLLTNIQIGSCHWLSLAFDRATASFEISNSGPWCRACMRLESIMLRQCQYLLLDLERLCIAGMQTESSIDSDESVGIGRGLF